MSLHLSPPRLPRRPEVHSWTTLLVAIAAMATAAAADWQPRPVPEVQTIPLPFDQVSFQRHGTELCRYVHAGDLNRPFVFPVQGPSGRSLTRMGHPHDPESHSHHNSVWISHHDVDGVSFWDDRGLGRIVHQRVERLSDGPETAAVITRNDWLSREKGVLLHERRRIAVHTLPDGEWQLVLDIELAADRNDVVLGKTPFGPIGVRLAKTLGVHDGGGRIRNSAGGINEAGCFWKPARWVDYSGAIAADQIEGLTLFDHPANSGHPNVFHVRDDGWMGVSLTHRDAIVVRTGHPLRLRYALYVHHGAPPPERLQRQWQAFAELPRESGEARSTP